MVRRRTGDVVARLEFGRRQPKSERQLFVEAHSSKGQASLLRNRLHPAILARSPGAFFTARHVLSQKSLHRNLNALRSVNLDHRIAEAS